MLRLRSGKKKQIVKTELFDAELVVNSNEVRYREIPRNNKSFDFSKIDESDEAYKESRNKNNRFDSNSVFKTSMMYVSIFVYVCKCIHVCKSCMAIKTENNMAGEALRYIRFYLCMYIGVVEIVKYNFFYIKLC